MPVAAFIIVVMGLLAAGMGFVSSQTSIANAQEQVSVQTFYAAESGAQFGMNRLFYDTGTVISRSSATSACNAFSGNVLNFSSPGMQNCQTTVDCAVNIDAADTTSFFDISSTATCGITPVTAQRTIDVSTFLQ
jgi:MSHA biogenesis protein MshP